MWSLFATASILWLATLFAYSGSLKLVDYERSLAAVSGYRLLPDTVSRGIGAVLPWAELTACGFLLVPATRMIGAAIAVGLGTTFAIAAATALLRRLDVSCGCTAGNSRVNRITLIRSLAIVAGAVAVMSLSPSASQVLAIATAAGVVLALAPAVMALRHRLARRTVAARDDVHQHHHHRHNRVSDAEVASLTALLAQPPSGATAVTLPLVMQERA